ncbi:MAG: 30S ribosome-binding factor RbfA [Defluviitaleaceae bacterium]|nr:30S ribosome-binding factor RbfA [Defluviitaleaceae bacterium]
MKARQIRINEEVTRVIANIIRSEMSDPRIGTVVSVIRAEVTADLKYCKVWVSVPGDEARQGETMAALTKASGFIRRRVAETVNLRHTPEITFIYDDSIAYGMRMRKLIDEANQ